MKPFFLAFVFAALAVSEPVFAGQCPIDQPGYVPEAVDASSEPKDILLVSIDTARGGALSVRTAMAPYVPGSLEFQIGQLSRQLRQYAPPEWINPTSPLDLQIHHDTLILFQFAPKNWKWADDAARAFSLEPVRANGGKQVHNPFVLKGAIAGRPDIIAVRFVQTETHSTCQYAYELRGAVRQSVGGRMMETPFVLDPRVQNGGSGGGGGGN